MLDVSTLNTISSLISKALSDNSISDEEYSLILLEFETFTRMKEDLRIKSKTSLEKPGNIETEASVFFYRSTSTTPTCTHVQIHVKKTVFKTVLKTMIETVLKTMIETVSKTVLKNTFEMMFEKLKI